MARKPVEFLRDRELEIWLSENGDSAPVILERMALRIAPLAYSPDQLPWAANRPLIFATFRALFIVWAAQKYELSLRRSAKAAVSAVDFERDNSGSQKIEPSIADAVAYTAARAAAVYAGSSEHRSMGVDSAEYAVLHASNRDKQDQFWACINDDIRDSVSYDVAPSRSISNRLWTRNVLDGENYRVNFPMWARRSWDAFKGARETKQAGFDVWIRWYESLLIGRKQGFFDQALSYESERDVISRIARAKKEFWERDTYDVAGNILDWIEEAKYQKVKNIDIADRREATDDQSILVQRPASHRFDRQGEIIEASAVKESPFDPILAETIVVELREKIAEALSSLTQNNADDVVTRALTRLSDSLNSSPSEIAEGVLLMRANTLAAHKRAYADPISERERTIRAILDDLSSSVDNLVDCYPGIRQINANRLALDMQAETAPEVEAAIGRLIAVARESSVVGTSAIAALTMGEGEVEDLTDKISRETNIARAADYIATRGQVVASRLLDATNFVSAGLQGAGRELAGINSDTWKEIRKAFPKAAARGISRGAENVLQSSVEKGANFGMVMLAYWLGGPIGALAVLVPRLKGHAQKANEIRKKIQGESDA